jgi:predicted RNase H-like HicB family nuclease
MPRKYLVIIERVGDNFNAYVPNLPGCPAARSAAILGKKRSS